MKKIMILGTSKLQIPALIKAKELGYYVIGVDKDSNSLGKNYCDSFHNISILDKLSVLKIAIEEQIDGIFTMATDRPMTTVAFVSKIMNLNSDSEDTILNCTNKVEMRIKLNKAKIPIPKYKIIHSFSNLLIEIKSFPKKFIIKSSDNSGKRGIYLVKDSSDINDLTYAFEYAMSNSNDKRILIEEILSGLEFSVEAITYNGYTEIIAITKKINSGEPRFIELQHSQPSELDSNIEAKVRKLVIDTLIILNVMNSSSHTEVMVVNGQPYIIEIGARLGGDYITSHLVPLSTGYDIVKESVKISMGVKPIQFYSLNRAAIIRYFDWQEGFFAGIKNYDFVKSIKGVIEIEVFKDNGYYIKPYENSNDRLGCIIVHGDSIFDAKSLLAKALETIEIISIKKL
jgi:biotin carboxylase